MQGLTGEQARQRAASGAINTQPEGLTPTVGKIFQKNILTLFNLINLSLAILLVIVGEPKNTFFLAIAIVNTALGIIQELRSKRTLDKLSILNKSAVTVMRDGRPVRLPSGELVLDDIVMLGAGEQVCADAAVLEADGLEVNEALLTGESDNIRKHPGDKVLSGSFVTAGNACVKLTAVGGRSFAAALTVEAKKAKDKPSRLMKALRNIIRVLTIIIIPFGTLLFTRQYAMSGDAAGALLGASAGMTGMIPQGLVMLTGVTLTVSAVSLARRKALVQSLSGIETLARADVLCLDKTGTITDGTLSYEQTILTGGFTAEEVQSAVARLMSVLRDDNATAKALRAAFGNSRAARAVHTVPFSSARKWSGATLGDGRSYILGAPGFVFPGGTEPFHETARELAAQGLRVLCVACSRLPLRGDAPPGDLECMALLTLSDTVRRNAPDVFRFFAEQGVALKVISGDDPLTVSHIARNAGIAGAEKSVDMRRLPSGTDLTRAVENSVVFGRVSPSQKRELIRAMQRNGHTTCMTGDGVNDVLAMKESDCSVAMVGGSAAARDASDFVLMTGDFSAMINVLNEGRRVINNIERIAALYLLQTIYATLLLLAYTFLPYPYPYVPQQMTPASFLTVGVPSFILALRANFRRPEDKFITGILELSLPAALTVLFNVMIIQTAGVLFDLPQNALSTMNIFLIGVVGLTLVARIARPLNKPMFVMLAALGAAFVMLFIFGGEFFSLDSLLSRDAFFYLPLALASNRVFTTLSRAIRGAGNWWRLHRRRGERR